MGVSPQLMLQICAFTRRQATKLCFYLTVQAQEPLADAAMLEDVHDSPARHHRHQLRIWLLRCKRGSRTSEQ